MGYLTDLISWTEKPKPHLIDLIGDTPVTQNVAVKKYLEHYRLKNKHLTLPELKAIKPDRKNTIASHSKIISNLRKQYRKHGQDIVCYETHYIRDKQMYACHTEYEIVD